MRFSKYWQAFCIVLILGTINIVFADTGIDGAAMTSSSFTLSGLVNISSLTASNITTTSVNVSTITSVSSATITNATIKTLTVTNNITASNVVGITDGSNALPGNVGEIVASSATNVAFPGSGIFGDLCSVILTPGDWRISGVLGYDVQSNTGVLQRLEGGISTTSGNSGTGLFFGLTENQLVFTAGNSPATWSNSFPVPIPTIRVNITTTTTYYLKYEAQYTGSGNPGAWGNLLAERRR